MAALSAQSKVVKFSLLLGKEFVETVIKHKNNDAMGKIQL